ncbi:MAG: hypothetical protein RRZ69_06990, partial [Clostridia bacterium]
MNETDRLFSEINSKFIDEDDVEPQVMSKEEAEKENIATQETSKNVFKTTQVGRGDDEIVRNAFSNLNGERTIYKNEGGSPTYIYNQIFPNQN